MAVTEVKRLRCRSCRYLWCLWCERNHCSRHCRNERRRAGLPPEAVDRIAKLPYVSPDDMIIREGFRATAYEGPVTTSR